MQVIIQDVDLYGHLGRDFHPKTSDIGLEGRVTEIFVETNNCTFKIKQLDRKAVESLFSEYTIYYTVHMFDGRILQLLDEEVEIIPAQFINSEDENEISI